MKKPQQDQELYHKTGRSVTKINSFWLFESESSSALGYEDDVWFYLRPEIN